MHRADIVVIAVQLIVSTFFIGLGASAIGIGIYAILNPLEVNSVADAFKLAGGYIMCTFTLMLGVGFTAVGAALIWYAMKWIVLGYNGYDDGERHTGNETIAM